MNLQNAFARWLRRAPEHGDAERLYAALNAQSRTPELYRVLGVPDSLDGRFDALCLHMFLAIRRLGREAGAAEPIARALYDSMFKDMDRTLRELGIGDLGVGRRVRQMAEGLMGRIRAYGEGIESADPAILEAAIRRNLLGTLDAPDGRAVASLARYVRASDALLASQPMAGLLRDGPRFASCEGP